MTCVLSLQKGIHLPALPADDDEIDVHAFFPKILKSIQRLFVSLAGLYGADFKKRDASFQFPQKPLAGFRQPPARYRRAHIRAKMKP